MKGTQGRFFSIKVERCGDVQFTFQRRGSRPLTRYEITHPPEQVTLLNHDELLARGVLCTRGPEQVFLRWPRGRRGELRGLSYIKHDALTQLEGELHFTHEVRVKGSPKMIHEVSLSSALTIGEDSSVTFTPQKRGEMYRAEGESELLEVGVPVFLSVEELQGLTFTCPGKLQIELTLEA